MANFAILTANDQNLEQELQRMFPGDHIKIRSGQWLVRANSTAKDISDSLKISDGSTDGGMVILIASYWGQADTHIWEWLAVKP